jgi:hypothetical protein
MTLRYGHVLGLYFLDVRACYVEPLDSAATLRGTNIVIVGVRLRSYQQLLRVIYSR